MMAEAVSSWRVGRKGRKSPVLVGSVCAGTWHLESVSALRYSEDDERKALEEKGAKPQCSKSGLDTYCSSNT